MPRWVAVLDRIIPGVGVSVERLWIGRIRHNRVWTKPPAKIRVIPPCPHMVKSQAAVLTLAREPIVRRRAAGRAIVARLAKGPVPQLRYPAPAAVQGQRRAA